MHKVTRHIGIVAFVLFLVKGLLWLSVPALIAIRGCAQ